MKRHYLLLVTIYLLVNSFSAQNIQTIYFDFDNWTLRDENKIEIKNFIETSKTASLQVSGYTDPIGTDEHNIKLANQRTAAVVSFLVAIGADTSQITILEPTINAKNQDEPYHLQRKVVIRSEIKEAVQHLTVEEKKIPVPASVGTSIRTIDSLDVGASLVIENLEFLPGRHFPQPYSEPALINLHSLLEELPNLKIEIQGHVCCIVDEPDGYDSDTRTWNLSVNRAKFVYSYLIKKGIDASRLSFKGFGGAKKIYSETDEASKQANRRVELVIIEK